MLFSLWSGLFHGFMRFGVKQKIPKHANPLHRRQTTSLASALGDGCRGMVAALRFNTLTKLWALPRAPSSFVHCGLVFASGYKMLILLHSPTTVAGLTACIFLKTVLLPSVPRHCTSQCAVCFQAFFYPLSHHCISCHRLPLQTCSIDFH
ncbi:hypothetical protein TRVL_02439 [Trypanosoma vivax]|nr:hypothetical protein TRVL_02439 [Trypanosoma vivax]